MSAPSRFIELPIGAEFRFLPTDLEVWWEKVGVDTARLVIGRGHCDMVCEPSDEVEARH